MCLTQIIRRSYARHPVNLHSSRVWFRLPRKFHKIQLIHQWFTCSYTTDRSMTTSSETSIPSAEIMADKHLPEAPQPLATVVPIREKAVEPEDLGVSASASEKKHSPLNSSCKYPRKTCPIFLLCHLLWKWLIKSTGTVGYCTVHARSTWCTDTRTSKVAR